MNEINNILSDINHTTVTAEQVNKLISDISSTFTSSADTVFGAREQVRRNYNNNNKRGSTRNVNKNETLSIR
jgi:S-adenosylmethionine:diacylglycerol 3-amino-3-carboxypropyl transferase